MPNLSDDFARFVKKLNLTEGVKRTILDARERIQNHLRQGLEAFSLSPAGGGVKVTPRFYIQGSWAYDLVNMPGREVRRQVDFDLGVYLPVSYLGSKKPSIAAKEFFSRADYLLEELAKAAGWSIDQSKRTCTRVILSQDAHFDLPLYSIPDGEFQKLAAKLALKANLTKEASSEQMVLDSLDAWEDLPFDEVLLAMRGGDWKPSDPRRIHAWFKGEVVRQGEQLKLVCRVLKAWRDQLWDMGGPSSIFLMAACCRLFRAAPGRLDSALLGVLKGLPGLLQGPVYNPTDKDENFSEHQKPEDLVRLAEAAVAFAADLEAAINAADDGGAWHQALAGHLGARFPLPAIEVGRDLSKVLTPVEKAARIRQQDKERPLGRPWYRG